MERLRSFLITRLVLVLMAVAVCELMLAGLIGLTLLPFIRFLSGMAADNAGLMLQDLPRLIWGIISGNSGLVMSTLSSSFVVLISLAILLLLLAPVVAGIFLYAHAVTGQVARLEREREAERRSYEEKRNLMLSNFAHDLRTPIMTISGYADALSDGMVTDPAQKNEYLTAISAKSRRMAELIDLLFEYVRLGSAGFSLHRERLDLHAFLAEIAAGCYADIEDAGMTLDAGIPEEPYEISADAAHLKRVFENLLINAVRHNPPGTSIRIQVRKLAGVELVAVADSGTSITKTEQELFEPFVKGDDSRNGSRGSGLGLSVVRQIVDMHGFEIHLQQPFGSFTKAFVVKIPAASDLD